MAEEETDWIGFLDGRGEAYVGDTNKYPWYDSKFPTINGTHVFATPEYRKWYDSEYPDSGFDDGWFDNRAYNSNWKNFGWHHGSNELFGGSSPVELYLKYVAEQAQAQRDKMIAEEETDWVGFLGGISYGDHPLGDPNSGPNYWASKDGKVQRNVVAKTELYNGVPVYQSPEYQEWILKEWPVDVASSLDYGKGGKAARHWGYHHGGTFSATAQEKWGTNTPVQGFLKYVAEQAQAQKKTSEIK